MPRQEGAIIMAVPSGPTGRRLPTGFRLISGLDVLDRWSEQATQIEKNIVHQALFAVVDRSVFTDHLVVDDVKAMDFFVVARCELVLKIHVHDLDSYGIIYIGPACAAPGFAQVEPETGGRRESVI